jgi:peptidoglycan/LPS O-acetylase OafA/YrhL
VSAGGSHDLIESPSLVAKPATFPPRYAALDHWRGIAALIVVIFHATAVYRVRVDDSGCIVSMAGALWLGVQLFFVISGYCIAAAVESSFRRSSRPVRDYLFRRLRRIFPPYLIWLGVLCIVIAAVESLSPQLLGRDSYRLSSLSIVNWVGNVTLSETWLPRLFGGSDMVVTRVGWTLCYELQFYLVCMLLMFAPQRWFYHGVAAVTFAILVIFVFEQPLGLRYKLPGTFLDGRWLQFAIGIWVFHALTKRAKSNRLFVVFVLTVVALIAFASLGEYEFGEAIDKRTKRILELGVCSVFGVVLIAARAADVGIDGIRWLKPLQRCGVFSYSLYLVHWPICKVLAGVTWKAGMHSMAQTLFVTVPLCMAASLAAGALFYRLCEQPFLNTRNTMASVTGAARCAPGNTESN